MWVYKFKVEFLPFILDIVCASSPSLPASKIPIRACRKVRNKDAQSSEAAELLAELWTFLPCDTLGSKSWCRCKKWWMGQGHERGICWGFLHTFGVFGSLSCTWSEPGLVGGESSSSSPWAFLSPPAGTCCSQPSLLSQITYFHVVGLLCLGFFGPWCWRVPCAGFEMGNVAEVSSVLRVLG